MLQRKYTKAVIGRDCEASAVMNSKAARATKASLEAYWTALEGEADQVTALERARAAYRAVHPRISEHHLRRVVEAIVRSLA
jgi:hypothetical protein